MSAKSPEDIKRLTERLSKLPQVRRYSDETHDEAGTLAHAFEDIEETCEVLLSEQFPQLARADVKDEELCALLLKIGEQLRHLLYHVNDARFYAYLQEPTEASVNP